MFTTVTSTRPARSIAASADTYTLAIRNDAEVAATVNFTASLLPAVPPAAPLAFTAGTLPGNAVTSISTTFTAGNQLATQSFDVTQSELWSLQALSATPGIAATLTGPLGTVASWSDLGLGAAQNAVYLLPKGHYTLTLTNRANISGSATLSLRPLASAVSLDNAPAPSLSAMTVGQQSWYSIDAHSGDTISAGISSAAANSDFLVTVYDASGNRVIYPNTSGGSFTTSYNGQVTVLIQRVANSGGSASLSLSDTAGQGAQPPAVQPGSEVDWKAPAVYYNFSVASDGLVAMEWDNTNYQTYQLTGPNGIDHRWDLQRGRTLAHCRQLPAEVVQRLRPRAIQGGRPDAGDSDHTRNAGLANDECRSAIRVVQRDAGSVAEYLAYGVVGRQLGPNLRVVRSIRQLRHPRQPRPNRV